MFNRLAALIVLCIALICASTTRSQDSAAQWSVASPDQNVSITVTQNSDGALTYTVNHASVEVIHPSRLGIVRDDQTFADQLIFDSATPQITIDETYEMLIGRRSSLRNHANEIALNFHNANNAQLQIILRAYDDGVAFRYFFPETDSTPHTVTEELTSFKIATDGQMWSQPYDQVTAWSSPAYERYFTNAAPVGTRASFIDGTGWAFPALFHADQRWILISEADLGGNYFGAHLGPRPSEGEYEIDMPLEDEALGIGSVEPTSTLPWLTPWRMIIVGETPATILESSLVYHLSAPSRIADTSWIQAGRASWSWWSDHNSPQNYESLAHFVDLAAEMGWEYSLVDANWDRMQGGNLEQLVEYANQQGVGLLLWYNSGGAHNAVTEAPRDLMFEREIRRAEFERISALGIRGVKVDFFQSDQPYMIQLYLDILADAADYHLLVNFHGSTIPRGWSRTYPNLMTMEAVRGAESYTFDQTYSRNAPVQNTILPFTRNVVGPMDYTPVTFTDELEPHFTTNAHELALSIVFDSGITHLADSVEAYENLPDEPAAFLRDLPTAWDETLYLAGEPGSYVIIARRSGDRWYIGGINGQENAQEITLNFAFLNGSIYATQLIQDGADRLSFDVQAGDTQTRLTITMQPYGGFVITLFPSGM